jgi:predicted nucleotidyltransferase
MQVPKPHPVESFGNLRTRVERLLLARGKVRCAPSSLPLGSSHSSIERSIAHPTRSIAEFLDFLSDAMPQGDLYLFGGIIRDLALFGKRGFDSDVDIVVEGEWEHCVKYLEAQGAHRNKFGGYRLSVAGWPVDVWNAEETWAIRQGIVAYKGIGSLTETTVLNWDAILMNWKSRSFVHKSRYLQDIRDRTLDVVLEENPNPLGMAVRVFRHLCLKDARRITRAGATYLAHAAERYSFQEIRSEEIRSYGTSLIPHPVYRLFECLDVQQGIGIGERFGIATETLRQELGLMRHPD